MSKNEINSVLITGGTGSFGKAFSRYILENTTVARLAIFSRDELKQFEMQTDPFFLKHKSRIRYFIGDVRDADRLKHAFNSVDWVIHAAALKQVVAAEYNPIEAIKTNIIGAQNVIEAAIYCGVKKTIALSSDKAAAPINLYGATKLCSDKLFVAANNFVGGSETRFSVIRYGNVFGSRGSVVPFFLDNKDKWSSFPITHQDMTRFTLTLDQCTKFVHSCFKKSVGGEIFIPKIPSYKIFDICKAIDPKKEISIVGIRPGEKIHEVMITESDLDSTYECDDGYVILPTDGFLNPRVMDDLKKAGYKKATNFTKEYSSGTNTEWLTAETLKKYICDLNKASM